MDEMHDMDAGRFLTCYGQSFGDGDTHTVYTYTERLHPVLGIVRREEVRVNGGEPTVTHTVFVKENPE